MSIYNVLLSAWPFRSTPSA